MKYIWYLITHFDEIHPTMQAVIYTVIMMLMVGILMIGQGKYF